MNYLKRILTFLVALYKRYPARANVLIASAVVAVAGLAGIVVSPQSVITILVVVIPILIPGFVTHHQVTPVKSGRRVR
jgi:hypothetical protein